LVVEVAGLVVLALIAVDESDVGSILADVVDEIVRHG
jgi:hypothetical protein